MTAWYIIYVGGEVIVTAKKRVTLRIPMKLDELLSRLSVETGISKNALILQFLWESTSVSKKSKSN